MFTIKYGDCPEEQSVPTCEPYLSQWCALHQRHIDALDQYCTQDGAALLCLLGARLEPLTMTPQFRSSIHEAVELATAKFDLYRASLGDPWARKRTEETR